MIEEAENQLEYEHERDSLKHAELLVAVLNAPHYRNNNNRPYEVSDFWTPITKNAEKMTPEQYETMMLQKTIAMGGQVVYK